MGKEAFGGGALYLRASGERSLLQHMALGTGQRGHAYSLVGSRQGLHLCAGSELGPSLRKSAFPT